MANKPRHTRVNTAAWLVAKGRYQAAMEDGAVSPIEHNGILDALGDGVVIGQVMESGAALEQAVKRSTDPVYVLELAELHIAHLERMPA